MRIYQVNLAETWTITKPMIDKNHDDSFTKAAMKAQQILLDDLLVFHDGWHVASSAGDGSFYTIQQWGGMTKCTCPSRLPVVNGHTRCKHLIALDIYHQILEGHLNAVSTLVDIEEQFGTMWDGSKWVFVLETSRYEFARWLGMSTGTYENYSYEPEFVSDPEIDMFLQAERDSLDYERSIGTYSI